MTSDIPDIPADFYDAGVITLEGLGEVLDAQQIRRQCRNRACVNPGHFHRANPGQKKPTPKMGIHEARRCSKSGVRGVYFDPTCQHWRAQIGHRGHKHRFGRFDTLEAAEAALWAMRDELAGLA
jgi:AP2 domain